MIIDREYEQQIRDSQAEANRLASEVGEFTMTPTSSGDTDLVDWLREGADGNGLEGRTPQELAEEWDNA